MSIDHKPTDPNEKARIEKAGGSVNMETGRIDESINLSRCIGDFDYKKNEELGVGE